MPAVLEGEILARCDPRSDCKIRFLTPQKHTQLTRAAVTVVGNAYTTPNRSDDFNEPTGEEARNSRESAGR